MLPVATVALSLMIDALRKTLRVCNGTPAHAILPVLLASLSAGAGAQDLPARLDDGWQTRVKFAGEASAGASRSSSISLHATGAYRRGWFGTELEARFLRRSTKLDIERTDADGQPVLDEDGDPSVERVSERLNDRRFVSAEPRWYLMNDVVFLFGLLDFDRDRPTGLDRSTRTVLGIGYRLWDDKRNFLVAGVGAGYKHLVTTDEESIESGIGYLGVKLSLDTSERTRVRSELVSDFGSETGSTDVSLSLGVDVVEAVELLLSYEARVYDDDLDEDMPRTDSLDARFIVGLEIELP